MRGARHRHLDAFGTVDVTRAEAALVADEIAIHLIIEAVDDAAQGAIALAGRNVATDAAGSADARCSLQVPLAAVLLAEDLVGEDAGRAHLGEVAGEFAFEGAVLETAKVRVVMRSLHAEVGA